VLDSAKCRKNQHEVIQAKMLTATQTHSTTMHNYVQLSNNVQVTEIIHYALIHSTLWGNTRTESVYQITVSIHYTPASVIHYQQKF